MQENGPLRYRRAMTKSPHKLVLRKETLRQLTERELTFAVGGVDDPASGGLKTCPAIAFAPNAQPPG